MQIRERAGRLARHPVRNRRHRIVAHHCRYGCGRATEVRNMSRRSMLTHLAPSPPIDLRTTATGGNGTAATSTAATFTATLAGSLQICVVGYSKGSTTNPTISLSGSGWVLIGNNGANVATINSGAWVFARAVTAGQTTFTVTCSASVIMTWTVEEWLNVDTASIPVAPTIPFTWSATTTTGATTQNSNTITTTGDGDLVWSFLAGRGPSSAILGGLGFGGGATINNGANPGRPAFAYTAYQLVPTAGTGVTHTMSYTNAQGSSNTVRGSVQFKQAA